MLYVAGDMPLMRLHCSFIPYLSDGCRENFFPLFYDLIRKKLEIGDNDKPRRHTPYGYTLMGLCQGMQGS